MKSRWNRRFSALRIQQRYALVLLTAVIGIALSALAFSLLVNFERDEEKEHFEETARDEELALESSIALNVESLDNIRSLYKSSSLVERSAFRTFVAHSLSKHPGIQALEWIPRVPASERDIYEETARTDGFPEFSIVEREIQGSMVPADFREEYYPVYFVEPRQGNETALGFDLASNPVRLEALNKSRDTGQSVATARITLVQESEDQFGFLVFQPIYRNGFAVETVDQRRENLEGFALGVFRVKDMLEHSLAQLNEENGDPGLEVQLFDRSAPQDHQLLFATVSSTSVVDRDSSRLNVSKQFDVAGRTWEMIITSPEARLSLWSVWQSWVVLGGGLLFTGLLSAYLLAGLRRTAAVELLVAAPTVELSESNQLLEEEIVEPERTGDALRRSNDQNQGLLDAIPDLMYRLSPDGEILEHKAAKDAGPDPAAETSVGKRVADVFPPDIAESCINHIQQALSTGRVQAFEYQQTTGEETRDFEARAAASGDDEVLLIVRDITERLTIDRMKDEFVSVVSHELRTPLTSIRGSLGLIAGGSMGSLPERAQRMAEIAVSNTDRLIRLINDILDIERIESGTATMERTGCDVASLLVQAASVTGDMAEDAGVTIFIPPISVQVWADPDRLVQTFTNLLSNAIKFSPRGGAVELAAWRDDDQVIFQVTDHGRGIPSDNLDTIFERFQQVDASDSRDKGGTGLGLAICSSIVRQHGGRIWVESTEGEGSTFFVSLPVINEEEQVGPIRGTIGPLVLICDDDKSIRDVVETMLEDRGYRVVSVATAQAALAQAVALRPSVILLDLIMPGMDGWEAMTALKEREDTKDIPIVIFSVLTPGEARIPVTEVDGWIPKPLFEDTLVGVLNRSISETKGVAKLLLVEDDPELAGAIAKMLDGHGVQVFHARTGAEAIQLTQQILPDVLILNLIILEDDDFSVAEWLRRQNHLHQVPLVVYGAKALDDLERERLNLGQMEFLTNGLVGPEEVGHRVAELLSHMVPKTGKAGESDTC